jgi:LysR family glycine cleavage system transcriptional activator
MRRRLPSLNALRAFEAAARHMSYKAAAEELCVSQSAVSHQVKGLEDALGITLFVRKVRGLELTAAGKLYMPVLSVAFDGIAEGTARLLQGRSDSVLTLQVYSTFTMRWLLPRLSRFQEACPGFRVHLHTAQQDPQFSQADIDAAIIIGQPEQPGVHYEPLFVCELFPVCSPAYLADHPELREPADLAGQDLLQVYPSADDWPAWFRAHCLDVPPQPAGLRFESYDVALASAVRGIGVALGQQPYMERDLKAGTLVEVFPGKRVTNPNRWFLACRNEMRVQAKFLAFARWLLAEVAADESLAGLRQPG